MNNIVGQIIVKDPIAGKVAPTKIEVYVRITNDFKIRMTEDGSIRILE